MWCSSSTFTSAGSIGSIPTGSMNLAQAELTTLRTTQQTLPAPSQTSQKGRRRMIKQDLSLIPLHTCGPDCWGKENLWKLSGVGLSGQLFVMEATRKKKERKKLQFTCLFCFLCGSTEEYIQCRLGKFFFLFPTHTLPSRSAVQVK